jgi:hypothetical protein
MHASLFVFGVIAVESHLSAVTTRLTASAASVGSVTELPGAIGSEIKDGRYCEEKREM